METSVSYSDKGLNQQEFKAYKERLKDYVVIKDSSTKKENLKQNSYAISLDETELNLEGLDTSGDEIDFDTAEAFDSIGKVDTKLVKLFTLGFNNIKLRQVSKVQSRKEKTLTTSPETINYLDDTVSYSNSNLTSFTKNQLRQTKKMAEAVNNLAIAESRVRVAASIKALGLAIATYTDTYSNIIDNMKRKNISVDKQVEVETGEVFSGDKEDFDKFISKLQSASFDAKELVEAEKGKTAEEAKKEFLDKISERVEQIKDNYAFMGDLGGKKGRLKEIAKDLRYISTELQDNFKKVEKKKDDVNSEVVALGRKIARDLDKVIFKGDLTDIDIPVPQKYTRKVKTSIKATFKRTSKSGESFDDIDTFIDISDKPIGDILTIGDVLSKPALRLKTELVEQYKESLEAVKDQKKRVV